MHLYVYANKNWHINDTNIYAIAQTLSRTFMTIKVVYTFRINFLII